jgi:hypothetical protein
VLKNAPSSTNPAEKAKGLAQLERALHEGPTSARTLVAHRELPATGAPKGSVKPKPLDTLTRKALGLEPKNGEHTRVLGYDVNVGQGAITYEEPITQRIGTIFTRFSGPDYAGRVDLAAYLKADGRNLNKNNQDAQLAARLEIIAAIADNLDRLDGVHTVDLHILNVGLLQWATDEPTELPVLLHRFKTSFPDEFDLFFALHRLDVRPDATNANRFILQKIGDDGVPKDMNFSELTVFFGKTIDQGRFPQTFSHRPEWAARFRLAALMSIGWRRVQVLEAARRFDRIRAEINGIKIGGRGGRLEVLQNVVTSKKGVALILDSFVVEPTRTKTELQALGLVQKPTATLDALDRSLTTVFEAKRPVSTPTTVRVDPRIRAIGPRALKVRNKIIDGRKLDVTHDSFKGW